MFLLDDQVVTSASDLTTASKCEFAFLRTLDAKLGRIERVEEPADPILERAGKLGDVHERRALERYRLAGGVVEIERPSNYGADELADAAAATARAFADGAGVVFQATFFDGRFIGFADFIVRLADGSYQVQDTKLARSAKVTALLQLAAYAEQLVRIGVTPAGTVQLLLGDGTVSEHRLGDIQPVYRKRRARLQRIIDERLADPLPVAWGDPRYSVCGHCATCEAEIAAHRDVLMVAGLRVTQRARLADAGITTIDQLATSAGPVDGIGDMALETLRRQAALQVEATGEGPPPVEFHAVSVLAALPTPDPGDIFFDFEGDPLYQEGADLGSAVWGLDYLFGLVEANGRFRAFWAHTHAEERRALIEFLEYVGQRRVEHPGMHIYHYAPYERTHLLSISARHGVGEEAVDTLLRENVLVDLYPLVRKSMRVGSHSYSIKKLEPLYMGSDLREGVANAADSIAEYADARDLAARGEHADAQRKLDDIADYNHYDCRSTLALRDWMLARAAERGILPGELHEERDVPEVLPSPLADDLLAIAGDPLDPGRSADKTAAAFAAAALDYHRREQKSFWWEHFARLIEPVEDWADTRDVLDIENAVVERDWHRDAGQRVDRRWVRLSGRLAPGSNIKPGALAGPFLLYEYPGPFTNPGADPGARAVRTVTVLSVDEEGDILVEETLTRDVAPYDDLPRALTPAPPPQAGNQKGAIEEWAQAIVDAQPGWPADAVVDILRRTPPRTRGGALAPVVDSDTARAVVASLLDLDFSYLAVQGPPGTGKTHLGAHVIAELVKRHRWKVGVVAQSHAVVENLLDKVVSSAGLDAALVGKVPKSGDAEGGHLFTPLPKDGQLDFAVGHSATGFVVGGTAWDFSNIARIPRHSLDLLVVDEAGQFSLAYTIAASAGAQNLLLLGDPQQLPQVSQGTHPEPIDQSALGWVSAGHDVLPASLGYFLPESRRMHAAVTAPVSALSYEGALRSHPSAADRLLEGVEPGLHIRPVVHFGNSIESVEEAAEVVRIVGSLLGLLWSDPSKDRLETPLSQDDIIVVTPYNAQLATVLDALREAGHDQVRVGTVDKFQGQEAAVAIVTLAASSYMDVPRGMSFLIMKNRLNVAISRAKWAAFLVHSPELTEYLPVTPAGVAELSAFIRLVEGPEIGS
ncbi:MAG TPA: TM0106 family RecB-like putative nuclease [Microbacteriaceae bacterium]|nr:TM0106 family RecB-like putative nuclease [Microbacteriaceae bacterium]